MMNAKCPELVKCAVYDSTCAVTAESYVACVENMRDVGCMTDVKTVDVAVVDYLAPAAVGESELDLCSRTTNHQPHPSSKHHLHLRFPLPKSC